MIELESTSSSSNRESAAEATHNQCWELGEVLIVERTGWIPKIDFNAESNPMRVGGGGQQKRHLIRCGRKRKWTGQEKSCQHAIMEVAKTIK
jgi:hypothetical protein